MVTDYIALTCKFLVTILLYNIFQTIALLPRIVRPLRIIEVITPFSLLVSYFMALGLRRCIH